MIFPVVAPIIRMTSKPLTLNGVSVTLFYHVELPIRKNAPPTDALRYASVSGETTDPARYGKAGFNVQ